MKKNRSRSIVTIIGVLLSATLFTAVTVFTGSLFHFLKENYIYDMGNYHVRVRSVDDSFLKECENDERTEALLVAENLGYAQIESQNKDKPYLYVSSVDDDFFAQMPVHLTSGRLPENGDEILLPAHLADNGKVYYSIGDQLTLELGKRSSTSDSKDQMDMGETDTDTQSDTDISSDMSASGIDVQQNTLSQSTNETDIEQQDEGTQSATDTHQFLDQSSPWQGTQETWTPTGTHQYTVVGFYERPSFEPYSAPGYTALTKSDASDQKEETFVADAYIRIKQPSKNLSDYILEHNLTDYEWMQNNSVLMLSGSFQYSNYGGFFTGIVTFFCLLIFAGSVALIYNAFSISVSERTRQFGLLSSLGATKKQIRKMVWQEAFLVSAIGIPLGIVTGIMGIGITLHFIGDKFNGLLSSTEIPMTLHVQWSMLLLAALIALATVLISAWVPSRRAMKVTAMEAIRQSKDVKLTGKEVRTGKLSMKLFGLEGMLGKKYFRRSRKKYRATIVSLAFSVILFIAASSYTQYLKESLVGNAITVSNYDVVFWTDVEDAGKEIPLDELKAVQGVKEAAYSCYDAWRAIVPGNDIAESYLKYDREANQKVKAAMENGGDPDMMSLYSLPDSINGTYDWGVAVYYLDEESYEKLVKDQELSREKYLTDGSVLPLVYNKGTMEQQIMSESYNWKVDFLKKGVTSLQGVQANVPDMDGYEYYGTEMKDDNGTPRLYYSYVPEGTEADIDSDTGKLKNGYLVPAQTQTIELGDRIDSLPLGIDTDHTGLVLIYPYHMLPSDISDSPSCYFNTSDHDTMLAGIKTVMTEKGFHVGEYNISDPYEIEQQNRNTVLVINVFTYGFIVLISLIAIANAFHTISTNLLLRRRDFAMLKSMGMTEKSMHRMLNYECLIYGSRALLFGLPIGFLTNICIARITSSIYRGGFRMPVAAYLLSIICVFVVVFVTMLYAMKKMKQDNPVEVLKNENL